MKIFKVNNPFWALFCFICLSVMPVFAYVPVNDPSVSVGPNAYVTFSTVSSGTRYYLGVDTIAAKSGTYQVAAYSEPCYATVWRVGPLYSPDNTVLADKNYMRTIESVYLTEKHVSAWLALGGNHGSYSDLVLVTNISNASYWFTQKDATFQGKYIQGYLYYFSDATGVDVYRYLTYDALFGFSRLYSSRPVASQRVSIWTRTTGDHMTCKFNPVSHTFGYKTSATPEYFSYRFRMRLEEGGDRFRSMYDAVEFYAVEPTVDEDQQSLYNKGVRASLEWASANEVASELSKSKFKYLQQYFDDEAGEYKTRPADTLLMRVDREHVALNIGENDYSDTIWTVGPSPKNLTDVNGNWADHQDYLHVHMTYKGNEYVDSAAITRRLYHTQDTTELELRYTPTDHTFPYFDAGTVSPANQVTFTVSGKYKAGTVVYRADGYKETTHYDIQRTLNITSRPCYRDTTWQPVIDPLSGDTTEWTVKSVALQDTLLVRAYLQDGTTSAIGSGANQWIQSVELTARNQFRVTAKPWPSQESATNYRVAILNFSYTYRHSSALGDTARSEHTIWILQSPYEASAGIITFRHQTGASGEPMVGPYSRQQVPELKKTLFYIPEEPNELPIHHDHWGYNRWFIYKDGENRGKDIAQNWNWEKEPTNSNGGIFWQLNGVTDTYSRGRFEVAPRLGSNYSPTIVPSVSKSGATVTSYTDKLACDISAYTDTAMTGTLGTGANENLSMFTEPTLSCRQIFDMQPANIRADEMASHMVGSSAHYMQEDTVIVPSGRTFQLCPQSAYKSDKKYGSDGNLQYIYYYNANENDNTDPNMGTSTGLDLTKAKSYRRIGSTDHRYSGDTLYHARVLNLSTLSVDSTKNVIMVNPRKRTGYVLGKSGSGFTGDTIPKVVYDQDTAKLREWIEDTYLNTTDSVSGYKMVLEKTSDGISIKNGSDYIVYSGQSYLIIGGGFVLSWASSIDEGYDDKTMTTSAADMVNPSTYIENSRGASYQLYMSASVWALFLRTSRGYIDACSSNGNIDFAVNTRNYPLIDAANQAWMFYEIIPPKERVEHPNETVKWQRSTDGGTTWVDRGNGWTGEEMDGGVLATSLSGASGTIVRYRLVSNHFQLAHFVVALRDPAVEGPSAAAIITEEEIDHDYEVLADLGLGQLPLPTSAEMQSVYKHLTFKGTQFGYHYPVGSGEHEIPANKRVFSDVLPAKGEYCVINKLEKTGHYTIESSAGAEHGWMYCFNRASKPTEFINFTYPKPTCTDQELTLVANFANPTPNSTAHVKADFYGYKANGDSTLIYSFLTGQIPADGQWYHLALPLASEVINKYVKFRCVGTVSAHDGGDAYLLFDRFRLIAKNRPLTSFQKRTTCVENDSIYLISRVDYKSSELAAGRIICFQFQKWDNAQNKYVPMVASDYDGAAWHRRPANTTEVYPGYYKVGMTAEESVETPAFKSSVLGADYGTIVVPEDTYNPATSNVTVSPVRKAAIDRVAAILGRPGTSYYDETGRIRTYSDIMTAQTFDFGDYANPQGKFYVNEGTDANPYWVMYIIVRVNVNSTDNGKFRIAMTSVNDVDDKPNFSDSSCSNERIVTVKRSVDMLINGETGWENKTRAQATSDGELIPANTSILVDLRYNAPADAKPGTQADCRFDLVRAFEFMRGYVDMTPAQQADADAEWERIYGCTVGDFQEAMNVFRADDVHNPNRNVTSWNDVTPESFCWIAGYDCAKADSMYNLLNRLIVHDRLFEVGLSTREIYIANNQDVYFYLRPIAASGTYVVSAHDGTDSIAEGLICNAPIWLELHSATSPDSLRFGYDKKFGDSYSIPVIRATKTVANTALPVRISAISAHAAIGWDSTYVVETNDPAWNPATSTFRYTQDRMVQERVYSEYYKTSDTVIFRPVNAAHIARLTATDCKCLNYDITGTTYDAANPRPKDDTEGTNVFIEPNTTSTDGCNEWHVLPDVSDINPAKHMPGYQVPNNFTLRAGYWYKFKTAFFNKSGVIQYNMGDNPSEAHRAYFMLAVVSDTARWTPSYSDRTNYWNDDNNWTPVVDGADFHESLARVPLEDTRVIIESPGSENMLPVVNNDSLGLLEWGFKTATCGDVLFKIGSLMYGQEKLSYKRAFVDVRFPSGKWRTFSPALDEIYSGDIYIPKAAASGNDPDFAPLKFDDPANGAMSATHNRAWPYLFFQSFYNQTVKYAFYNTDLDGTPFTETERTSAVWQQTNVIDQPLPAGKACAMQGWGPTDAIDSTLIVRLPKQESSYKYYAPDGTPKQEVDLGRTAFAELRHNLAYDSTKIGNNDGIIFPLSNISPAKLFWFGNASMALVDVYQLCLDNADKLEGDGTHFIVYELVNGSSYITHDVTARHQFYISPMRAIGLMAKEASTSLNIKLKPTAMVAMPGDMVPIPGGGATKAGLARRHNEAPAYLYISAANTTTDGDKFRAFLTIGEKFNAEDGYVSGEDALCVTSELPDNSEEYTFHTPLTMYSICDNKPLMYDVRNLVTKVPLVLTKDKNYEFGPRTLLSFATEGEWEEPLYLYDAVTNDSVLIINGMALSVETPQTDEIRYYINCRSVQDTENPGGVTTESEEIAIDSTSAEDANGVAYVYDMLGRRVAILGANDLMSSISLPTGVYMVQRGNKVERMVVR